MAPGIYTAEWDGRDSAGSACGADTYIIYIDTGLVREKIQAVVVK